MKTFPGQIVFLFLLMVSAKAKAGDPHSGWEIKTLNTAAEITYLTEFEKEVILEINKLRSNPALYAKEFIEPLASNYNGKKFFYPGDLPLITTEGVKAIFECVQYLQMVQPVPVLIPDKGLTQAAVDHVTDQSKSGKTGHKGRDQSGFRDRIERYGKWTVRIAENIAYGGISPQQVVIYLLIDDGVASRGHRKNFMNKDFTLVGVAEGNHPDYKRMCVMEFAARFQNLAAQ